MSEKTNIEWATSTFNPWTGCRRVSPGRLHCYMFALLARMGRNATSRKRTVESNWRKPLLWNKRAKDAADYETAHGRPVQRPRVFPSLMDWLDDEVPIAWLADFLKLIHDTPNLDWLLLTKRPELFEERVYAAGKWTLNEPTFHWISDWLRRNKPPSNVWIGVSVEDQKRADERLPLLAKIPARVRFASFEPLLEYVEPRIPVLKQAMEGVEPVIGLDWAIIGGESGPDRRDCGVEAICSLAEDLSFTNGIATFVKQDCAMKPGQKGRIPDDVWALKQFPNSDQ